MRHTNVRNAPTWYAFVTDEGGAAGLHGLDLGNRARLFLCYEAFEPIMFAKSKPEAEDALIELRHRLLTTHEHHNFQQLGWPGRASDRVRSLTINVRS